MGSGNGWDGSSSSMLERKELDMGSGNMGPYHMLDKKEEMGLGNMGSYNMLERKEAEMGLVDDWDELSHHMLDLREMEEGSGYIWERPTHHMLDRREMGSGYGWEPVHHQLDKKEGGIEKDSDDTTANQLEGKGEKTSDFGSTLKKHKVRE